MQRPSGSFQRGFTLVELLVAVSIILVLASLVGGAVSGARTSTKANATRATIDKLNTILMAQLATYDSKSVDPSLLPGGISGKSAARSWYIRRNMITGDMPDRWKDVEYMATPANSWVPLSSSQRTYINIWNGAGTKPSAVYAGAECLFMIIMQGGLATCLDCGNLKTSDVGDKDGDGFMEFWDAWGNPIGFILWPAGVELPAGSGLKFFSGTRALDDPFPTAGGTPASNLRLRPLIYSAGPDGEYSFDRQSEVSNLSAGSSPAGLDCGNWKTTPTSAAGGVSLVNGYDYRADNITNLDAEAKATQ